MTLRTFSMLGLLGLTGLGLSACTTTGRTAPAEVIRYHLGAPIARGTVEVQPMTGGNAPASIEFKTYAAAVQSELLKVGYTPTAPGTTPQFVAVVSFTRGLREGPPRAAPFSIGLGAGGFSGGNRGGGVGLGGGIGIPIGHRRPLEIVVTELGVTIKNRADQSPVWEGHANTAADSRRPDATAEAQAGKLSRALFTGFPGESGRTIEVR